MVQLLIEMRMRVCGHFGQLANNAAGKLNVQDARGVGLKILNKIFRARPDLGRSHRLVLLGSSSRSCSQGAVPLFDVMTVVVGIRKVSRNIPGTARYLS